MKLEVAESAEAATLRGANLIAEAARSTVAELGGFSLAVSGGEAPWMMFERLADQEVPWEATEIFQVDERIAPDGDPARNLTHLERCLPNRALERLHPMPVAGGDLESAASRYEAALPETLDVAHLGLGPDGHTASLVPDDSVLEVADRRVALTGGEYQGHRRMTLTYPALAGARRIFWLVIGGDKRDALARLLDRDPSIPAGRVEMRDGVVIADRTAAG